MAVASTTRTRDDQRNSREIQQDIEARRQDMDQTLEEIGDRLTPRHLLDVAYDYLRSLGEGSSREYAAKARGAGKQLGRELKQHPIPLLLVGAGVVWWLMEDNDDSDDDRHDNVLDELPTYRLRDRDQEGYVPERRLPAAWEDDYDWSAAEQDEQSWSARAQSAIDELRTALSADDKSEEERIRSAAGHLSHVSGRKRRELHEQWADLREHSGSVVDARTGEPYAEDYGHEWEDLASPAWTTSEAGNGEHDGGGWRETAQTTIQQVRQSLEDTTRSVKHRLRDAAHHLTSFAQQTRGRAGDLAGQARGGAEHLAERSRHAAGRSKRALEHGYAQAAGTARQAALRTREGLGEGFTAVRENVGVAVEQYPLAVGAAAFGLGLLAGLAVPETKRENRWMGEASDEAKRRVWEAGEDAASRGVEAVKAGAEAAGEELQRQGVTTQHVKEVAAQTASRAAEAMGGEVQGGKPAGEKTGGQAPSTTVASGQSSRTPGATPQGRSGM